MICSLFISSSCDSIQNIEQKSYAINKYEQASLALARENRELRAEISQLKFEINSLNSKKDQLALQLKDSRDSSRKKGRGRSIASITPTSKNDLVKFELYNWGADQMLAMGQEAFKKKKHEEAAQFFHRFSVKFPGDERINDLFLFQAGVASFESGKHQDWAIKFLTKVINDYPKSEFHRGAKLWMALIHLKGGDKEKFFEIVEEFRKKYKNTPEWKILGRHYEKYVLQKA